VANDEEETQVIWQVGVKHKGTPLLSLPISYLKWFVKTFKDQGVTGIDAHHLTLAQDEIARRDEINRPRREARQRQNEERQARIKEEERRRHPGRGDSPMGW